MARPVAFDRTNRELRTNRYFFADLSVDVIDISWFEDIDIGVDIAPDDELAEMAFADGRTEAILAPPWCRGTIERLRNPIPLSQLGGLSRHLLSLERA